MPDLNDVAAEDADDQAYEAADDIDDQDDSQDEDDLSPEETKELLNTAKSRFQQAETAEMDIRKEALEDLKFRTGDQWPDNIMMSRGQEQRPCLTINRLPQFVRQVTNDARHNRPSVKVSPVGDGSDQEVADVFNGLIRHIEVNSNADIAYDTAVDSQVTSGFGYFRVITDYIDENSFDQEIYIKRIKNPFTVYFDPGAMEPDYSDANWAFIVTDMTHEDYKAEYPDSKMASLTDFQSIGDDATWLNEDTIRIAEYFEVIKTYKTIYQLADGSVIPEEQFIKGMNVKNKRDACERNIKWRKINAVEVLKTQDWAGKWIPIIPVLGDDLDVDGKRQLVGLVRYARDPQRMLNYWVTAQTEAIALAPKAPWVVAAGGIKGFESFWQNANVRNFSHLPYNSTGINGEQIPPPQRNTAEPPVQAMTLATQQAGQYMKDTTGIYDASLGQQGSEVSGKAILARQSQSNISNFHFIDNLSRSIKHLGRILIDLIPKIYDAPRVMRIIQEDGSAEQVALNGIPAAGLPVGVQKIYDLSTGRYDVVVETGPNYSTKRQQALDSMVQISQAFPQIWQVAGDLMVGNMDWPNHDTLAERLKMTLPPQIQQAEAQKNKGAPQDPAQLMQQLNQAHDMLDKLTKELDAATGELRSKKYDVDAKVMMNTQDNKTNLTIEQMKLGTQVNTTAFKEEMAHHRHGAQQKANNMKMAQAALSQSAAMQGQQDMAQQIPPPPPPAEFTA